MSPTAPVVDNVSIPFADPERPRRGFLATLRLIEQHLAAIADVTVRDSVYAKAERRPCP